MFKYKLKWWFRDNLCKIIGHNIAVDPQGYNYCERCCDSVDENNLTEGWYNPESDPIQDIRDYIQRDRDRMKLSD